MAKLARPAVEFERFRQDRNDDRGRGECQRPSENDRGLAADSERIGDGSDQRGRHEDLHRTEAEEDGSHAYQRPM